MADVRIQQYPQKSIVSDNDIFLIADSNDVDVNGFLKYKKVRAKDLPSIVNTAESITYANLIASIAADDLIIGTFYKITDSTSGVSPLLVQAVGIDAIGYLAFDAANPLVTINYDVITDTIRWSLNQTVAPVPTNRTITAGTGLTGGGDLTANRTFAIDSTVTTLTGTQTLTNKTLTSPIISEVLDSNGNEILGFTPIASATDYITIKNGIGVGVPVHISATGSSANTGIHIEPKGTGLVQISDGTDTTKGIRFRSSGSATSAVTLIDAVSSAGRVITLPNATGTLALTSDLTAYVPTTRTVSTTSPIIGGGALSSDLTISIPQSSGSVNGYLSSTDFATFNAKQNAITLTTTGTSGAATLVGSTLNIPNYADTDTGITSLNGLTALTQTFATGTSGTDFAISSATSTHTFNLPTASASNRGALSSADWTTFNNKASTAALANYLPLAGGTLTGALGGTSANFNSTIASNDGANENAFLGNGFLGFYNAANTPKYIKLYDDSNNINAIGFSKSGSVATTWFPSGNVGIGTTTPSGKLHIKGNAADWNLFGQASDGSQLYGIYEDAGAGQLQIMDASGTAQINFQTRAGQYNFINNSFGIGTTTDAGYKLDVNGTARVSGAATFSSSVTTGADATINGVKVGKGAGNIASNTAVGFESLKSNTTGSNNTALGKSSLTANTTGSLNCAIGVSSLINNTTGSSNVSIGFQSLFFNLTGSNNVAVGLSSLQSNTASNNTAVGYEAALSNTSGTANATNGYQALRSNTTGGANTANGFQALYSNIVGSNNTAIGASALALNTAPANTAVGFEAAYSNTSGAEITAVGYQALRASTGGFNTAMGNQAMLANTSGVLNSAFGRTAMTSNTTGGYNAAFGASALVQNVSGSNNTAIGTFALTFNTASNNTAVGYEAGYSNTSGDIVAVGYQSLRANTTGQQNTAVGLASLSGNTTGNFSNAFGYNQQNGNFSEVSMIGISDTATGNNQMRFGSVTIVNGAVATEVNVSSKVWNVFINGVAQKILLA